MPDYDDQVALGVQVLNETAVPNAASKRGLQYPLENIARVRGECGGLAAALALRYQQIVANRLAADIAPIFPRCSFG